MSKRKSKKSKNTTLIVFLVITFTIAIALLLYFLLRKENFIGELLLPSDSPDNSSKNMTEDQGKGCTIDYDCKGNLKCMDESSFTGKGTCKCGYGTTKYEKLTSLKAKKFFKGMECVSKKDLDSYNKGTQKDCESIGGVWDGSECTKSE